MEKRDTTRIVFNVEASVEAGGKTITGQVENLSMTGIFLVAVEKFDPDSTVNAEIHLSGTTSMLKVELKGRVVRTELRGMAIRFEEIDLDSFIHLRNIIAFNEGDGDKVMNEFYHYLKKH